LNEVLSGDEKKVDVNPEFVFLVKGHIEPGEEKIGRG
jgi:hypothetical protein